MNYKQNANLINHLIFYSREDGDFWIMLLLWIIEPWPAVVGGAANCVHRQSFVEVFPEPTQWFPWQSRHCFQRSTVWGSEHRGYQILFLTHRDFSTFSDSSDDVMNCRWWDILSKLLAILDWRTLFWKFSTICNSFIANWWASELLWNFASLVLFFFTFYAAFWHFLI